MAGTDWHGHRGDGGPADSPSVRLYFPTGVAVDSVGNVYIANLGDDHIRKVSSSGIITTVAGIVGPENLGPTAVARLSDPQEIVSMDTSSYLVAGGSTGTVQRVRTDTAWVDVVAGRYLEPERLHNGKFRVDFNLAYNPYCAYNELYSCPLPPAENRISVPISAGEKNFTP